MQDRVGKCRIKSVEGLNPYSPVLVNFEHGHYSKNDDVNLKCSLFVDEGNVNNRTLIVSKDDQQFFGNVSAEGSYSQSLLLIRNKKTNKARVFVAQSCTLIDVQREEEILKRKRKEEAPNLLGDDNLRRHHNLQLSFGSKKSKRASNVALRMNLNVSSNKEDIKEIAAKIDIKPEDIKIDDSNIEILKLLPHCNRDASVIENVYNINDLLTEDERGSLKSAVNFLLENTLTEKESKNFFFLSKYMSELENPDEEQLILLLYGDSLVRFFNMSAHDMRAKDNLNKICPHSRSVASKILNIFTVQAKSFRSKTPFCKDKIVCFLMVTLLLVFNYKIDLEPLASCLKGFGIKKLLQLARVVGLKTIKKDNKNLYALSIPLPPLPRVQASKRKRT